MMIRIRVQYLGMAGVTALVLAFWAGRAGTPAARSSDLVKRGLVAAGKSDTTAGANGSPDLKRWELFYEVIDNVQKHFVRKNIDQKELTYGAVRGMLKSLNDQYTSFLTPEEYDDFRVKTEGEFFGIGAQIYVEEDAKTKDEALVLVPIEGSPADRAGLKGGDQVLKIDGKATKGMAVTAAVSLIRGPRGSKVTLTILRKAMKLGEPAMQKEVSIERDLILYPIVISRVLDDNIGYIQLTDFNEKADKELDKAYEQLKSKNVSGLIFDLRGNPGGLLEVAINVASRFVKAGAIVRTEGRTGSETHNADPDRYWNLKVPVVVLINHYSASASEIVAGAVQDHKVAQVLGENSYGKASVQVLLKLKNGGGLKITTARYMTPNGTDLSEKGVKPDIVVELPKEPVTSAEKPEKKDIQLERAMEVIKKNLASAGGKVNSGGNKAVHLAL